MTSSNSMTPSFLQYSLFIFTTEVALTDLSSHSKAGVYNFLKSDAALKKKLLKISGDGTWMCGINLTILVRFGVQCLQTQQSLRHPVLSLTHPHPHFTKMFSLACFGNLLRPVEGIGTKHMQPAAILFNHYTIFPKPCIGWVPAWN